MSETEKFEDFLDKMQGLLDNAKKQGHIIVRTEDLENTFSELNESKDKSKPNGAIVYEGFNEGDGFYKVNLNYLNKEQVEEIEEMVKTWNERTKTFDNESIKACIEMCLTDANEQRFKDYETTLKDCLAWLGKQGEQKPNYCHHEVDLSNCSDEYRKAYYDGWNNCNIQHSQCKSENNDVIKCLISGLNFYYEHDEEAYWGTAKFPMKIKDILSWLQKQLETN